MMTIKQIFVLTAFLLGGSVIYGQNQSLKTNTTDIATTDKVNPGQLLNPLANHAVILPDMTAEDWPDLRKKIYKRVVACFGDSSISLKPSVNQFVEISRYQSLGLIHIKYRYHVIGDIWNEGILVLPHQVKKGDKVTAILTVHGTNGKDGKLGVLGVTPQKNRAYGIELAERGYITFSPDLMGFGPSAERQSQEKLVEELSKNYPNWSYKGLRILLLIRAIDMLEQLPFVNKGSYGTIGNSLGGESVLFDAAFDPRIKVCVPSTGVSPAFTNGFRLQNREMAQEPEKWQKIAKDGKPPYDLHEIIALCAPRSMLFLDDFNDPYNPDTRASFEMVYQAMQVYSLLGTPEHISILIHGDGHDTIEDVREYAYRWFDRFLPKTNLVPLK